MTRDADDVVAEVQGGQEVAHCGDILVRAARARGVDERQYEKRIEAGETTLSILGLPGGAS